ncbi:MAG: hypothetical protein HGA19_10140, partial [Oscillochloris sp.]|nr:hypothetical protein [Oscillochloris sp.]
MADSTPVLRIHLLGELRISINGVSVTDVATRKAEALLLYLACNPRTHRRELLSELLWDDLSPERAGGNLRLVLNQLRPHFAPFLDITRNSVAIRDGVYWLDLNALQHGLAGDADAVASALELYQGDFLQGFHLRDARGFSEWQQTQAEHWRRVALDGMRRLAEHHAIRGSYNKGLNWARRLLAIDPLDEAAHRQVMVLLARSDQRHEAARQYQICTEALQAELGIAPEEATTALYQRILATQGQRWHTQLPRPGRLIGRAAETTRLYEWLAGAGSRLLTITGAGGSGKTQLALTVGWRVASELAWPFADGVYYLALVAPELEMHIDVYGVLMGIVQAFGLTLSGRIPLAEQVERYLALRELLLIIDNGELLAHDARLLLGNLLHEAPALRVLVPSRERLQLREEQVLAINGLSYPRLSARATADEPDCTASMQLAGYPAVQLLLRNADLGHDVAMLDAFAAADRRAISQICQMVHGLPLAIELAAPWLNLRSPRELAQDLAATIDILRSDAPDLPERHRSIRAVFEGSWRLLPVPEALALARLGVFPASFTAKAAATIAGAGLPTLAALHDKSLVQTLKVQPETRYMLHPLLQRFALEKLQTQPQVEMATRTSHAHYYAAFAQAREGLLNGALGMEAMSDLEREIDNLRAGWRWATAHQDIPTLGRYSIPLHDFCAVRGWEIDGRELFAPATMAVREWAERPDRDEGATPDAVRVLSCYAELQQILGDSSAAERAFHDCRIMLNAIAAEDSPELLFVYKQLGLLAYGRGSYAEAMQYLRLTLAIAEDVADRPRVADTLLSLGAVALALGEWASAEQTLRRGLAIYDDLQYDWGRGHTLRFLGALAMAQDDLALAERLLADSLAIAQQIGNRIGEALVLDQIGLLRLAQGQFAQSGLTLGQALELFRALGVELGIGRALGHLGCLALKQGQTAEAYQQLVQAMVIAERIHAPPLLIECAATALQLLLADSRAVVATLGPLVDMLAQHPACTAETHRQLAMLAAPCSKGGTNP